MNGLVQDKHIQCVMINIQKDEQVCIQESIEQNN